MAMGANNSIVFNSNSNPMDNDSLLLFAKEMHIPIEDQYWDTFLTFSISAPTTREMDEAINNKLKPLCKMLYLNNMKSGNFSTLLKYTVNHIAQLLSANDENDDAMCMTRYRVFNALFITRYFVRYLIEHTNESEMVKHFAPSLVGSFKNEVSEVVGFKGYIQILVDIIVKLSVTDHTYDLHIEAFNSLFIALSISLSACVPTNQYAAYRFLIELEEAEVLMQILIQRYIEQWKRPMKSSSALFDFASDLWHFVSFHLQDVEESYSPLASHAIQLMLLLINHCTSSLNPYRMAISSYSANVSGLYRVLCQFVNHEESTLLLYHLLHTNINFRNYFLARSDIELMLLPLMKRIYNAADNTSHHTYMSLIIVLILTEDVLFNKTVHNMILRRVSWYTERVMSDISLGGLVILVTVKTIQYNLLRMRDKYLHTNCLATLANMSTHFTNLHPYVCQRIISLFEVVSKTHSRTNVDIIAVEETIRVILEVINSCLTHQLIQNTNLVYTLLYNKRIFQPFRNNEAFQDIIQNINLVLTYFSKKLEQEVEPCHDVNDILQKVQRWSHQWPTNLLKKFPDLKFKYVEEEKPEEFFIPYVWSLIGQYSGIYWNAALYRL